MILVDTGIWVDHLRSEDKGLVNLLEQRQVLMHPFIRGELACGNLRNRAEVLGLLGDLPQVHAATHDEVMYFIEHHHLMGKGIGYVDAHLLASAALMHAVRLWTRDKRLDIVASKLALSYATKQKNIN